MVQLVVQLVAQLVVVIPVRRVGVDRSCRIWYEEILISSIGFDVITRMCIKILHNT